MGRLIKMPSELEVKQNISILIYGEPGIGKTTLGVSAPDAVLFDYDGGVQRINGAHRVPTLQVTSWEQTQEAIEEIARELPNTKTFVFDTAGKMLDFMSDYIIRNNRGNKKVVQMDGSLGMGGYGIRKTMFINFVNQLKIMGKNVVFIAHEREEKRGEDTVKRPEIGGSSVNDLIKELDLVGYMRAIGKKRIITFDPEEHYYAKNTCNLKPDIEIPINVDANGNPVGVNNFLSTICDAYIESQKRNQEKTREYDKLVQKLKGEIANIQTSDDANMYIDRMNAMDEDNVHIFNSRMVMRKAFSERIKELGLSYNKETACYE